MQSQQILKMSSSSLNAGRQASVPLVDGIVNHALLQSGPDLNQLLSQLVHVLHFFVVDPILHHSPNLVIYWVEILTIQTLYYMALLHQIFINFKWYKTPSLELSLAFLVQSHISAPFQSPLAPYP